MNKLDKYFSASKTILIPCFHLVILFLVYQLLAINGFIPRINVFFFKQWDSYWYASIAENGYQFSATKNSNVAFFPLFPYIWKFLWKLTGTGVEGVCLYNVIMFISGMLILKKAFKFSWSYFLLFVSVPSCMFMYVPYSEATFFFFSAVFLFGLKTNDKKMALAGLFLASLARPSAAFFIPALVVMELMAFDSIKTFLKNLFIYSMPPLLAILLVFIFQYHVTGVWLAFFKDGWARVMQLPEFPLTTWGGFKNLWLDASALFFGLLSSVTLLWLLINKIKGVSKLELEKSEMFSLTYVIMALVTILLFGGKDEGGGTTLLSLNRFLMATPFFAITLYFLSHRLKLNTKTFIVYTSVACLTLLLLNLRGSDYSEYHTKDKIFYSVLMFVYIMLFYTISLKFKEKYLSMIYLLNVFLQVLLLCAFAKAQWVG